MALGFSEKAIRHRVKVGRLHQVRRGVYSVGPPDLRVRRRPSLPSQDVGTLERIPITSPVRTMIDLATKLPTKYLCRAVNEADKLEVVETDGLRYHRTPSAQTRDALRDQAHTAAGYARLRFSHH